MQLTDPIDLSQVHAALAMRFRAKQSDECIAKENAKKSGDNFLVFSIWISMPTIEENIRFDSSQFEADSNIVGYLDLALAICLPPKTSFVSLQQRWQLRFRDRFTTEASK